MKRHPSSRPKTPRRPLAAAPIAWVPLLAAALCFAPPEAPAAAAGEPSPAEPSPAQAAAGESSPGDPSPGEPAAGGGSAGRSAGVVPVEGAILKTIESAVVAAEVVGVLEKVVVSEGSQVEAGQLLARVDDEAIRITLKQLKTQLEMARRKHQSDIDRRVAVKNREVAANEYQRALAANARIANTYPLNEIDRLKLIAERSVLEEERAAHAIEIAGLEVAVAQSEYEQSEELLRRHAVHSPMSGVVVAVEKHVGEWVEPGVELFRLVRTDRLRVEGFVPAEAADGLAGRRAAVRLRRGGESIKAEGEVVFVSPDVNPVNSVVRVFIEVDNARGLLRPGLRVDAAIAGP